MLTEVTRSAATDFVELHEVSARSPSYLGEHRAGRRAGDQVPRSAVARLGEGLVDGRADRLDGVGGEDRDDRATEAATGHPRPVGTGVDRGRDGQVELGDGDLEVVAHRGV